MSPIWAAVFCFAPGESRTSNTRGSGMASLQIISLISGGSLEKNVKVSAIFLRERLWIKRYVCDETTIRADVMETVEQG